MLRTIYFNLTWTRLYIFIKICRRVVRETVAIREFRLETSCTESPCMLVGIMLVGIGAGDRIFQMFGLDWKDLFLLLSCLLWLQFVWLDYSPRNTNFRVVVSVYTRSALAYICVNVPDRPPSTPALVSAVFDRS